MALRSAIICPACLGPCRSEAECQERQGTLLVFYQNMSLELCVACGHPMVDARAMGWWCATCQAYRQVEQTGEGD